MPKRLEIPAVATRASLVNGGSLALESIRDPVPGPRLSPFLALDLLAAELQTRGVLFKRIETSEGTGA